MKYLLVSDTHANLEAFQAVLAAADHDRLVFLGDAVDYGPDPEAVVELLRGAAKEGGVLVRGNHDEAAAADPESFDPSWWSETAVATLGYTWSRLGKSDRAFLGGLPLTAAVDLGAGGRALACHGSPASNLEYVWPESDDGKLRNQLGPAAKTHDAVWLGHTHLPFYRRVGALNLLNPGSVGQPRDGDWRASCAVYDADDASLRFMRVEYDLDRTSRKLRERGVPHADRLAAVLRSGGGAPRARGGP